MNSVARVFAAKAVRVFVFGLVSVITPVYLTALGYSPLLVGIAIATMIAGSAVSNMALLRFEGRVGRRRFLVFLSLLMLLSGLLLFSVADSYPLILLGYFIGNVSATGTEAGPFQSVEAGMLPNLVPEGKLNRTFGAYNMIGYGAASVGAFAASLPSYFQDDILAFRSLYLLFGLIGLVLLVLYHSMRRPEVDEEGEEDRQSSLEKEKGEARGRGGLDARGLSPTARREVTKLSLLFAIDAFGGGLVSQSLLVYWFFLVYGVSLGSLGAIFFIVNVMTALSMLGASFLADRIGNLRTMVYSHLISNLFLVLIPLAGSLSIALLFLFARQSLSQMDVPTRQAFMARIFDKRERVSANAMTNTSRIISSVFGSPVSGALLGAGLLSLPLVIAGLSKILYDILVFSVYRRKAR